MKKTNRIILIFVQIILSTIFLSCSYCDENNNTENTEEKKKKSYNIIFLGDSITYRCDWVKLLNNNKIGNFGIGGNKSTDILNRIDSVLDANPKKVFLMCGVNDFSKYRTVNETFSNLIEICDILRANDINVIIQSTLYTSPKWSRYIEINNKIKLLNDKLIIYCNDNYIDYIDVNSVLSENGILIDEYTIDGVHLYPEAYEEWKILLVNFL